MPEKNPHAVALGRKGGKARLEKMTAAERQAVARNAVQARWEKQRQKINESLDGLKQTTAKLHQDSRELSKLRKQGARALKQFEKRNAKRTKKMDELLKKARG